MLVTFEQLRDNVLTRGEEEMGASLSEFAALVTEYLDRAYFELLGRRPWLFAQARAPLILELQPPITNLTVTWAAGAYLATLSGTPGQNLAQWKMQGGALGQGDFRIVGHDGATTVLMEAPSRASLVGAAVTLFKDEYSLFEIPLPSPTPVAALVNTAGNLAAGTYHYVVTLVGRIGETAYGTQSNDVVVVAPNTAGRISLTIPAVAHPRVRARAIYRSLNGGSYAYVGSVPSWQAATFEDNVQTPSSRIPPGVNTTAVVRHIVDVWAKDRTYTVDPMDRSQLREYMTANTEGTDPPSYFTRVSQDVIRLSEYPSVANFLEVDHTELCPPLSDSQEWEIQVPRQWRWVLADFALGLLLEQKLQERAKYWLDRFEFSVASMVQEDEKSIKGYAGLRRGIRYEVTR